MIDFAATCLLTAACSLLQIETGQTEPPQQPPAANPAFTWPTGEVGDALRTIGPDTEPAPEPTVVWPDDDRDPVWRDGAPWQRFGELLAKQAAGPLRLEELAELALVTLAQGRDEQAWRRLGELARRSPEAAAGILPRFFPGVPAGIGATRGGLPLALPEGIVLTPALPPPLGAPDPEFLLEARSMSMTALAIGSASCNFTVDLRTDGVDLRFETVRGTANARGVIPMPPGFKAHAEYADWDRQEQLGGAHPVTLDAAAEDPWRLWGRFKRAEAGAPTQAPRNRSGQREHAGLELHLDPEDPAHARLAGLADAIEIACGVLHPGKCA